VSIRFWNTPRRAVCHGRKKIVPPDEPLLPFRGTITSEERKRPRQQGPKIVVAREKKNGYFQYRKAAFLRDYY
jgi:hypothetical protein